MPISRLALALLATTALTAQAPQARVVRPFLSLAFTTGGDTLATAVYTDGSRSSIKAGGQTFFKGGLDFQVNPKFSLQASLGIHTDSAKEASNGSLDFKRNTLEGLGYFHPGAHSRLGLGFRKTSDAKVSGGGAASLGSIEFSSTTGIVLEWEYLTGSLSSFGSRAGFSVRYVKESYEATSVAGIPVNGSSVDGSHLGLGFSWYF